MPTAHPRRPATARPIAALLSAAVLSFGAPAQAAGSCDEMKALAASGLDLSIILETLNEQRPSLTPDELACVEGAGLRVEIVDALRPYVREPEARPQPQPQPVEGPSQPAAGPQAKATPAPQPFRPEGITRAELLEMERSLPSGAVAVGLATAVGFGTGHFYARRPLSGAVLLLGQAAGVGMVLAGIDGLDTDLVRVGGWAFGLSRTIEIGTAAIPCRRARIDWLSGERPRPPAP